MNIKTIYKIGEHVLMIITNEEDKYGLIIKEGFVTDILVNKISQDDPDNRVHIRYYIDTFFEPLEEDELASYDNATAIRNAILMKMDELYKMRCEDAMRGQNEK